jgi:hypothetical protein
MTDADRPIRPPLPTHEQRERADWDLLLEDLRYRAAQNRWESRKAIALIALAFAAVFAAGGFASWIIPSKPLTVIVRMQ